jgi:hypothetical protein
MMTEVRAPEHGNHMESLNYSFAFVVQAAQVGSHKHAGLRLDHGVWLSMVWLANVLNYLQHLNRVLEFVQCVAFSFEVSFILELVMTRAKYPACKTRHTPREDFNLLESTAFKDMMHKAWFQSFLDHHIFVFGNLTPLNRILNSFVVV